MLSYSEMGSFFENTGMLLRAGVTVNEAIDLLKEDNEGESPQLAAAYRKMSGKLEEGESFAGAMKASGVFPRYAVDMVDASEYTGKLETTLFHLAEYYRTEFSMKNTLVSAVRYPIILLLMVIAVLAAMLLLVFPAFAGVYDNLTGSLAASSYQYISISFTLCKVLTVIMAVLVVLLIIGSIMWKSGKREAVKGFLSQGKTFRRLFETLDLYRFTACFDMFISGGEMQDEALKKSLPVVEGKGLRDKLNRCVEKMEAGRSFSQVAVEERLYDPINNRMLVPAERSGMLDAVMQKILGNLRESSEVYIGRIAGTVEPLLTGFLMITIGLVLVSLMVPLIGIMNSIG